MPKKKEKTEKKEFRAQYSTYGLTYSRCPLEREVVVEELVKLLDKYGHSMEIFYCARETHKEEAEEGKEQTMYHIHIWFELIKNGKKPNFKSEAVFDIHMDGKTYHPNIGKKNKSWIYNYLKKQDDNPYTNIPEGYIGLAQAGKLQEAIEMFQQMHPKDFVINRDRVLNNFRAMSAPIREEHVFPFTGEAIDIPEGQSLLVVSGTNQGKTEWAKSFVKFHLNKTYLRVTHIDHLKKYCGEDYIIWDDCDFNHLPRTTQIHIAEVRNERQIHCRHTVANIPPGIINIFLANVDPFSMQDEAISRRLFRAPSIRFY